LPLICMMVSLSSGLSILWNAIVLLHFIDFHRIILNHYVGRTRE
jgi:5'-3' exonuclease